MNDLDLFRKVHDAIELLNYDVYNQVQESLST